MPLLDDDALFRLMEEKLYSAVISDILDALGFRNQTLAPHIRPLYEGAVAVGRAHTALASGVYATPEHPYEQEIAWLDTVKPGDVLVVTAQGNTAAGIIGELFTTAVRARGGRGAIVDGFMRDSRKVIAMQFPVFCTGRRPTDSNGRVSIIDRACPIQAGGVLVREGDLIFGDLDGIVLVPREVEEEVVRCALEKVEGENRARELLLQGHLLREAWQRTGVL